MGRLAGADRVVRAGWRRDSPRLRLPHTRTLTPAMLLAASVLSLSGAARGEGAWGRSCADAFESEAYEVAQSACREAAERGSAAASFRLALLYAEGRGVRRDYALAVRWLREAAVQGHQEAAYNLGVAYQFANGLESDNAQAAAWGDADSGTAGSARDAESGTGGVPGSWGFAGAGRGLAAVVCSSFLPIASTRSALRACPPSIAAVASVSARSRSARPVPLSR